MVNLILQGATMEEFMDHLRTIVREELAAAKTGNPEDEKLLSPKETIKLFSPQISLPTLHSYAEKGLIPRHRIASRVYYKKSEVLASLQTLKRYKPSPLKLSA